MIIKETIDTKITYNCDVLVCGGGVAGIAAALAAARQGKKVILLERQFMLGGLASGSFSYYSRKRNQRAALVVYSDFRIIHSGIAC